MNEEIKIEDVTAEMDWWWCFNKSDVDKELYELPEPVIPSRFSTQASHRFENSSPPKKGNEEWRGISE